MSEVQELEIRRQLQAAMQSEDAQAELAARRKLAETFGHRAAMGGGDQERIAAKYAGIDTESGVDFGTRAGLSVKMTPEGKRGYLESKYGADNVAVHPNLGYMVRNADQWQTVEDRGLSLADLADMTGGAMEVAPAAVTGFMTANPLAAGAAGVAGNVARQTVSGMLPGEDRMTLGDRAISAGLSGVGDMAGAKAGNMLVTAFDKARPHNLAAQFYRGQMNTPRGDRAAQITERTGIEFMPGQASGSRGALTLEGLARRHPASADRMQQFDESQVNQAYDYIKGLQNRIDPTQSGADAVGGRVSETFRGVVEQAGKARSRQWDADFSMIKARIGDQPAIETNNLKTAIEQIVEEMDTPLGFDAVSAMSNKLKGVLGDINYPLTPSQVQRTLSVLSKARAGQAKLFSDLDDKGQTRYIAGKLAAALERDLDEFSNTNGLSQEAVTALRTARANWRKNSEAIEGLQETALGRLLGGKYEPAPEKIVDAFSRMRGSEIRRTAQILDGKDPEVMNQVRSAMLQKALTDSAPAASTGYELISPAKFNTYLRRHQEQFINAFVSSGKNKELGELKMAYEALGRMANRGGTDGSPTAPLMLAWDAVRGLMGVNPTQMAMGVVNVIAPRKLANALTTSSGRRALIALKSAKPGTRAHARAMGVLAGFFGTSSVREETDSAE